MEFVATLALGENSFFFPFKSKLTSGWPIKLKEIWPFFAREKNTTFD
jgi:hypothetical protein